MPAAIPATLDALRVSIDSLEPFHRNPRRGDVPEIVRSLRRLGQYRPVVVNRGSLTGRPDEVLAGNHTLEAARALGWEEIAATFVDVDEDTAARIVAVDNRTSDLASYDDEALVGVITGAAKKGSWRAALVLLEREFPEQWSGTPHSGGPCSAAAYGGPVEIVDDQVGPDGTPL